MSADKAEVDRSFGASAQQGALVPHTHPLSAIQQSGATENQVPKWNGSAWVPSTVEGGASPVTPVEIPYASPIQPDCNDGLYRKIYLGGDLELWSPLNYADGTVWKCRLYVVSAATLTLGEGILVPSDSTLGTIIQLTAWKMYYLQLERHEWAWTLQSLVGGFDWD